MGAPWVGQVEGRLPHGWLAHGASSLCFGSHLLFPPVWKPATSQTSELGGLSAESL